MADETSAIPLHGPGGQGKTRLANHAAKAAQAAGWNVLRGVSNGVGIPGQELVQSELPTSGKAGVMVIVDDAERWPGTAPLSLMQEPVLQRGQTPLRILLVARPGGIWR